MEEGRSPILLTERKEHLETTARPIEGLCPAYRHSAGRTVGERTAEDRSAARLHSGGRGAAYSRDRKIHRRRIRRRPARYPVPCPAGVLERHPRAICRSAASTPPWKTRSKNRGLRRQQGTDARENVRKTTCRLSSYGVSGRRQRNVIGIANKTQRHFHFRLPRYAYHWRGLA